MNAVVTPKWAWKYVQLATSSVIQRPFLDVHLVEDAEGALDADHVARVDEGGGHVALGERPRRFVRQVDRGEQEQLQQEVRPALGQHPSAAVRGPGPCLCCQSGHARIVPHSVAGESAPDVRHLDLGP
jgi:hypothetical protein